MSAQSEINSIIDRIEFKVSVYAKLINSAPTFPVHERAVEHYHFHMGRRRFWLKKLLETQLKEFDHG